MFLRMAGAENDVIVISDSEDSSAESEEFDDDETDPLIFFGPCTKRFATCGEKLDVRAEPNKNSIKYIVKGRAKWLKDKNIKKGDHCTFQYFQDIRALFLTVVFC
ncbi:hypothetical protein Hanom_Chr11g01014771 [Helianthus anomalus]